MPSRRQLQSDERVPAEALRHLAAWQIRTSCVRRPRPLVVDAALRASCSLLVPRSAASLTANQLWPWAPLPLFRFRSKETVGNRTRHTGLLSTQCRRPPYPAEKRQELGQHPCLRAQTVELPHPIQGAPGHRLYGVGVDVHGFPHEALVVQRHAGQGGYRRS